MFNKKYLAILILGLILVGCSKDATNNNIVMVTSADYEPFAYRNSDGSIGGFDIEISKIIAERLGKELQIEDVNFKSIFVNIQSGRGDFAIGGITANEEREESVDFSIPYFNSKQMALVLSDNNEISSKEDLQGMRIGSQIGSTGTGIALEIQELDNTTDSIEYDSPAGAVQDLLIGRLDVVILDQAPAVAFANLNDDLKVLDLGYDGEYTVIAVKKGNTELLNSINSIIEEIESTGELDNLIQEFFYN